MADPACDMRECKISGDKGRDTSHREAGRELLPVPHSARSDVRYPQLARCDRLQHEVADVVLSRVARAVETIERDHVASEVLRLERVPDRGALVDDADVGVGRLQRRPQLGALGRTGRLDHRNGLIDDHLDHRRIIDGLELRQHGQVDADRRVGRGE